MREGESDGWMAGVGSPNNLVKRVTDGQTNGRSVGGGEFVRRTENNRRQRGAAEGEGQEGGSVIAIVCTDLEDFRVGRGERLPSE